MRVILPHTTCDILKKTIQKNMLHVKVLFRNTSLNNGISVQEGVVIRLPTSTFILFVFVFESQFLLSKQQTIKKIWHRLSKPSKHAALFHL